MSRLRVITAGVALGLALGAPPAGAAEVAPVARTAFDPDAGPRVTLAGGRAFWVDQDPPGVTSYVELLRGQAADGSVRTLHRVRRTRYVSGIPDLAGSPTRLAFVTEAIEEGGEGGPGLLWRGLRAGPLDGPFPVVAGAERRTGGPVVLGVVVSSEGLVVAEAPRDAGPRIVLLEDGDGRSVLRQANGLREMHASGPYAAFALRRRGAKEAATRVEVVDVRTRTTVIRATVKRFGSMALGEDGTLAVATEDGTVSWATPAAPDLRELTERASLLVGLAGGRLAFFSMWDPARLYRVRIIELASGRSHAATPGLDFDDAAFDGTRLAYVTDGCVYTGDAPAAEPDRVPTGPACRRPRLLVDPGYERTNRPARTLRAAVGCPGGAADRCAGDLTVTARPGRSRRYTLRLGRASFAAAGGGWAEVAIRVRLDRLRRVHRTPDREFRVRLEPRTESGAGRAGGPVGAMLTLVRCPRRDGGSARSRTCVRLTHP